MGKQQLTYLWENQKLHIYWKTKNYIFIGKQQFTYLWENNLHLCLRVNYKLP